MKRVVLVSIIVMLLIGCGLRSEPKEAKLQTVEKVQQKLGLIDTAIILIKEGNPTAGIRAIDQELKQNPGNLQAYILLGQTYMHLSQYDQAVDSFRAALRIAPDQGEIYYMLAIVNGLRGRKDLAVTNAEKALLLFQQDKDGENFKRALVLFQGLSQE